MTPINKPPMVEQAVWDQASPAEKRFICWHEAMHGAYAHNDNANTAIEHMLTDDGINVSDFNLAMDTIIEQMLADAGIPVEPCLTTRGDEK